MIQNLTSIVSLGSLLILLYGVLQLITDGPAQECRMTYMFQYPQYTVGRRKRIIINFSFTFLPSRVGYRSIFPLVLVL